MVTEKKARETAGRYAKVNSEKLFQMFYDALPQTSPRFQELTADVRNMAEFIQGKGNK